MEQKQLTQDQIQQKAILTEKMGLLLTLTGQLSIAEKWILTGLYSPQEFTDSVKARLEDAIHEIKTIESKYDLNKKSE